MAPKLICQSVWTLYLSTELEDPYRPGAPSEFGNRSRWRRQSYADLRFMKESKTPFTHRYFKAQIPAEDQIRRSTPVSAATSCNYTPPRF